ncbi:hypothetical protein WDU94_005707, partial [Cyamophila willieti]
FSDVKKSTSLSGLTKGILGGNKSTNEDTKQEPTSEAPGFKAGDLIRPDRLAKEAKNAVYALKPDAVDWIDWKGFPYHSIKFKNDVDRILQRKQYDINQYNEARNTPLHVVVSEQSIGFSQTPKRTKTTITWYLGRYMVFTTFSNTLFTRYRTTVSSQNKVVQSFKFSWKTLQHKLSCVM